MKLKKVKTVFNSFTNRQIFLFFDKFEDFMCAF